MGAISWATRNIARTSLAVKHLAPKTWHQVLNRRQRPILSFQGFTATEAAESDGNCRRWAKEGAEDVAEEGLLEARRGFEEAGVTFEVADIGLDLARLYRAQKRTSEALDLLDQSERVFRRQGATGRLPVLEQLRTRVLAV